MVERRIRRVHAQRAEDLSRPRLADTLGIDFEKVHSGGNAVADEQYLRGITW
jgi:hypothetical protein